MAHQQASLIKWNSPSLVSTSETKGKKKEKFAKSEKPKNGEKSVSSADGAEERLPVEERLEILNSILPARNWEKDGQVWVQHVSPVPATTVDVVKLKESLDMRLQEQHARSTGICPIREELYSQCFDELLRQITIICAERGIALLSVRDEVTMTLAAYQSLYQSSVSFGMRKALHGEQRRTQHDEHIRELQQEIRDLHDEVQAEVKKIEKMERDNNESRAADQRKHTEEVEAIKARLTWVEDEIIDKKKQAKKEKPTFAY
jgi:dynein light intermediate chain